MTSVNQSTPSTPRHPIAVVAERTGLTQDLLRMWERRYGAVAPARSDGGQRLYSDDDIDRLRLLEAAIGAGRRVGRVARLSNAELSRLVEEDRVAERRRLPGEARNASTDGQVAELEAAFGRVLALDARGLDDLLRRGAAIGGVPAMLEQLVVPLLHRIGDEWHRGRLGVAAEHLASAVIESFVYNATRAIPVPPEAPVVLIATPMGSRHVIGAAMAAATAAADGWNVLFLGGDLPAQEIASAAQAGDARAVVLSAIYTGDSSQLVRELRELRRELPRGVVLLTGGAAVMPLAAELRRIGGVEVGDSLASMRERLLLLRGDVAEQ